MKQSRVSQLCYALKKKPMRWTQMQQFIWELNGHKGKVRHGYCANNIVTLKYKRVIAKNKDGLYILTALGKLNKDKPLTGNPKKNKKIIKEDYERTVETVSELTKRNCSLWNENRRLKEVVRSIRENVNMMSRGIYED